MSIVAAFRPRAERRGAWRYALRRRALRVVGYGLLLCASVTFLFPLFWMIAGSFKRPNELFSGTPDLLPAHATLENYQFALSVIPLLRNLLNSVVIATTYTALALLFCSLAGFAFAKMQFPGRTVLFAILMGTMMVPPLVGILPLFIIMSKLGWIDTYQAVIVPGAADAFGIFFLRQYIQSAIPDALLDAARIDGSGDVAMYWRIVVPLIRPALMALGIMEFMGAWNNFLWPLIALRSESMFSIVLAVATLPTTKFNTPWGAVLAGTTIAVVPLILVFLIFQKQFVSGIIWGALKE